MTTRCYKPGCDKVFKRGDKQFVEEQFQNQINWALCDKCEEAELEKTKWTHPAALPEPVVAQETVKTSVLIVEDEIPKMSVLTEAISVKGREEVSPPLVPISLRVITGEIPTPSKKSRKPFSKKQTKKEAGFYKRSVQQKIYSQRRMAFVQ